jgi:26-hydroxylase
MLTIFYFSLSLSARAHQQSEISELLTTLRHETKKPIDLEPHFAVSISNVICNLLMSVRFTRDDPKFIRFNTMIEEGMRLFGKITSVDYIPITQYFPSFQTAKSQIASNREEMFEFYREVIEDHRRTFNRENIRDLVDFYLLEIELAKENGTEHELFSGRNHDEQVRENFSKHLR